MTEIDARLRERMGYPDMAAAVSFGSEAGHDLLEIALIRPGEHSDTWSVVEHYNCDPEDGSRGSSSREDHVDEKDARAAFNSAVNKASAEYRARGHRDGGDALPPTGEGSVDDARAFFRALGDRGIRFHLDDAAEVIEGLKVSQTDRMAIAEAISFFSEASARWADPDFIYSLAGEGGTFDVEADYPGFIMDVGVTAAIGSGYPSMKGQPYPTFVVNGGSGFLAVQAVPGRGRLSEQQRILVTALDGASYRPDGSIDLSQATLSGETMEALDIEEAERIVDDYSSGRASGPSA